jgi:uncharacterized protein (DUF58 family)
MLRALHNALHNPVNRWFLRRLRTPEPGEVYLHHGRVFVLPTKAGWGCAILLVVMFAGSVNYSLGLGFALTFLLGACAMVDMHLAFRNLAHLHLTAGRVAPVFAGEEAHFTLHLANRRRHDRYAIWTGFVDEAPLGVEKAIDIAANSSASLTLGLAATQRGRLPAPRVRLQTRFPLGLLRAWTYWRPDASALVYPAPEPNAPPLPMGAGWMHDEPGPAGQEEFAGIRPYQAGDSMRRLAWRQIARLDGAESAQLVSKHFEGGAGSGLVLDYAALPASFATEAKLSRLTAWILDAEVRGMPYALQLGRTAFAADLGPAHQQACLIALAMHEDA